MLILYHILTFVLLLIDLLIYKKKKKHSEFYLSALFSFTPPQCQLPWQCIAANKLNGYLYDNEWTA